MAKRVGAKTGLHSFQTSGCLKALFGRNPSRLDAILINTAGGLTGGDRIDLTLDTGEGTCVSATTQAAERAYRAKDGWANVSTQLSVGAGSTLFWVPQELILFQGAALKRKLHCDLAPTARALIVEPVIFGRALMGETLTNAAFHDRIEIDRAGVPLYRDAIRFDGDVHHHLSQSATGAGAGAMASLIYIAPDAEVMCADVRTHLPTTGGATLLQPDVMALRLLADDSMALRTALLPILDRLTHTTLPASWRL